MTKSENIERIVVRGTNWVGDAVMAVPALRNLRLQFPNAHITLATRPWAKGLFDDANFIDEILVHEGTGLRSVVSQVRSWQKARFDLAVLFPNSLEAALVASLARVPLRIGYATEGRQRLLTHPLRLPVWRSTKHEVFYYLNVVTELQRAFGGDSTVAEKVPDSTIEVSEARKVEARALLSSKGVITHQPLVALCAGSINSRAKRWPAERYAELGDLFVDRLGAQVVLIGSAAEAEVSAEVSARMRNLPIPVTGETTLAELVAILSVVDLLVTNDTGPAHIASALNTPTLVIFGPTNPLTTQPFSPAGEVIRLPPECAPCMLRDCPIDHRCMTAISPIEVFERGVSLMKRSKPVISSELRNDPEFSPGVVNL